MTARSIMVQGTMSGVGKSLLAAGLCRVFAQDGYRVAPFKSQNMALNSSITASGDEMGRAQVVQAEAAGVEPEAAMNPILLKPTNDTGSQVIVNGQVLGTMSAREYFAYKHKLVPDIMRAYDDLSSRFDIIVIEGAGSPAEINLKDGDIVNMGMAKMAKSPVLLAGDIDRGGVFAQLLGTLMLLDDSERQLVKGLVVNKFRGDKTILDPGLDILRDRSGIPIAGVVPYTLLDIDDEDSLSERLNARGSADEDGVPVVDIAVVRLPRVSNFTDFIALDAIEGVRVRYIQNASDVREPDLIIVPGTKSTLSDLAWMRQSGVEAAVLKRAAAGTPVFGICGGFQMLGMQVSDPYGVEDGGTMRGMGLLPMTTEFAREKHQVRVTGAIGKVGGVLSGLSEASIEGYEIHMGKTAPCEGDTTGSADSARGAQAAQDGRREGLQDAGFLVRCGNVYGSYVHGIFDTQECAQALVSSLMSAKGLDATDMRAIDMKEYKNQQYDMLADVLRENMDMQLIYRILEEGA